MIPSPPRGPLLVLLPLFLALPPALAQSPTPASAPAATTPDKASLLQLPACTLAAGIYHCSKPALLQTLAATRTVSLVSQPANHASDAALASLAKALNKTIDSGDPEHPADLTLRLTPIEPAGVTVGTGTVDLATLNIFLAAPGDPTARLVWSETYNGDPDLPWPAVANALTRQFRSRLGAR